MFRNQAVLDFKAEAISLKRAAMTAFISSSKCAQTSLRKTAVLSVANLVRAAHSKMSRKSRFCSASPGYGKEFEMSIKAARFVDKR